MYKVCFKLAGYIFHKSFKDIKTAEEFAIECSIFTKKVQLRKRIKDTSSYKVIKLYEDGKEITYTNKSKALYH